MLHVQEPWCTQTANILGICKDTAAFVCKCAIHAVLLVCSSIAGTHKLHGQPGSGFQTDRTGKSPQGL